MKENIFTTFIKLLAEFMPVARQYLENRSASLPIRIEDRAENESLRLLKLELKKSRKAKRLIKSLDRLTKKAQNNEIDTEKFFSEFDIQTFMKEVNEEVEDVEVREEIRKHFNRIRTNRKNRKQ